MAQLYDLSYPFWVQMPVYPGDEPVVLRQKRSAAQDGYNAYSLQTGLHAGTHVDAPLHFLEGGQRVSDLALDRFIGNGCLLDVRGQDTIGCGPEFAELIMPDDVVLLWTGHSAYWGTEEYYTQHPVISDELADWLIARGIKLLGMDLPSPDGPPFAIHRKLLGAGIPLIENLTNLEQLSTLKSFEVMAFPLSIPAEGCPVRVVAKKRFN